MAKKSAKNQNVEESENSETGNFETKIMELENIVSSLERGEIPLDDSIELFEKGVKLYQECKKKLDKVEKKITKLTDSLEEIPLDDKE